MFDRKVTMLCTDMNIKPGKTFESSLQFTLFLALKYSFSERNVLLTIKTSRYCQTLFSASYGGSYVPIFFRILN